MHIPDGMLSAPVTLITDIGAIGAIGYGVSWINRFFDQKKVVLMAVVGSLIFALQMLNFAVGIGTSGHFAGGALAGIVLGPWAGGIVMTAVLIVQAVVFKDGGIIALGANVLNMAILAPFIGYSIYQLASKISQTRTAKIAGAFMGAWTGAFIAALAVALELWLSGRANLLVVAGSMGFWHAIIGIGEGIITAGFIGYLLVVRPDLVGGQTDKMHKPMRTVIITLLVIALLCAGLSFLASSNPDGLEFVYFNKGVGAEFSEFSLTGAGGILSNYEVAGVSSSILSSALAGLVGLALVGIALLAIFKRKKVRSEDES